MSDFFGFLYIHSCGTSSYDSYKIHLSRYHHIHLESRMLWEEACTVWEGLEQQALELIAKEGKSATLPSGEVRLISKNCLATVGQVGNVGVNQKGLGRAGSQCWLGKRPVVRGVVMNPVDHPMGAVKGEPQLLIIYREELKNSTGGKGGERKNSGLGLGHLPLYPQ
ncbi:hypothetical protein IEQ34_023175 [Dendrobium chrysotoxum]|uniref:Large ribosomal subunit protein uL2 C-terminal domain-containing protein n=1 Tax=Dendrobium chrysotoxum TaxID=161865 RepID=A0AAV7FX37_DENCH|nr:hypothetical protein IEQ34_023175 [Dendrobium chrysotoxum]